MTDADAVRAAATVLVEAVLRVLEKDPHAFSTRPCSTCQFISGIAGREWGCNAKSAQRGKP